MVEKNARNASEKRLKRARVKMEELRDLLKIEMESDEA